MWRAFVYELEVDPDRAKRAFIEFTKLDGQFHENVIVQVKNGPIDFQPREPFHPLFGAMSKTPLMAELQITQEYLGQANHLVFLAPMWKEFLDSDTHARGQGTPVSKTIGGICGVANTGSDVNWCGHHFAQANWYAFGRLAWDPHFSAEQIAREWIAQTFEFDRTASDAAVKLMLDSWETFVSYTMPLGLHHLIGGDHYAPQPWNSEAPREDWTAWYYHRADKQGIGFDRTRHGSGAVDQYRPTIRDQFGDPRTCPEKFLLWFHRLRWDHRLASGRNLWEELCFKYADGAERAAAMQQTWQALRDQVDPQRFSEVAEKLTIQARDARRWRDACLDYFRKANLRVLPAGPDASESRY